MAYDSFRTRPKRAAPSQSDADLTWTGIFLVVHKHYTFQVKVDVDACAPDELNFEANVSGGSYDVDAATVTTMVKRAKGAEPCPPPLPAVFCNATNILVDNKVVCSCGVYTACTFHIQDTTAAVNTLAGCLEFCKDCPFAFSQTGLPSCGCQSLSKYETDGWISTNPPYDAYAIGGNP